MTATQLVKELKAEISYKNKSNRKERTAKMVAKALVMDLQVRAIASWLQEVA